MKRIFICILSICFVFCGCSAPKTEENNKVVVNSLYVKSVWLTYYELESFTSASETEKDFEKAISAAFKKIKNFGLNTVTVQVRPCADAFYRSDYFPVSKYCFQNEGCELKYDPLKIMVGVAHNLSLRIEAWINPYRVSQSNDINELSDKNIAKIWYNSDDKKNNIYINDKIYFNPASKEVNELIINGVKEIVNNYAVDSIQFDDYFYPTKDDKIDDTEYKAYKNSGGELSKNDWRRENVSNMVKSVYNAIKEINSFIQFGISPQSSVSANYSNLYADVERWVTEPGFVDYICPQIYFGFYNEVQPFTRTAKMWTELAKSCKLYTGLPLYKSGKEDKYASSNQNYAINEFIDNNNIISRQISYVYQLSQIGGIYIFSYDYLINHKSDSLTKEVENISKVI